MDSTKPRVVLVTGSEGFLGRHVVAALRSLDVYIKPAPHHAFELTDLSDCIVATRDCTDVIHCAGYNGGIEFNRKYPATILERNTIMGLNLFEACVHNGVEKIVAVTTSCAYPDTGMVELHESSFWNGQPNKSIRAHGVAKRVLQTACEAYSEQFGFSAVAACITNLFGPYDTFNLERTKVVGALIRKVVEAKQDDRPYIECWGTGRPLREFMYVADAAKVLVQVLFKYNDPYQVINIGSGDEISIKDLVNAIVSHANYPGEVRWLTEKGDGQMKKLLNTDKMRQVIGEIEMTSFHVGLANTIDWYVKNKEEADRRK